MQAIRNLISKAYSDRYLSASLVCIVPIFLAEALIGRGYASWALYVIPVILAQRARAKHAPLFVPLLISVTIASAHVLQPHAAAMNITLVDAGLDLCSLWAVTWLLRRIVKGEILLQRKHDHKRLIEHAPHAIMRFDSACRLVYANRAAAEIAGSAAIISPEDWTRLAAGVRESLEADTARTYTLEVTGSRGPAYYRVDMIPEAVEGGGDRLVTAVFQDFTALKKVQGELERLKEYYKTLADHSPDGIARIDDNLRFTYVNSSASTLLGKLPEYFIGKSLDEAVSPEEGSYLTAMARSVFRTGLTHNTEITVTLPGGKKHLGITIVPERDSRGDRPVLLAIMHDISDIKNAAQVLYRDREALQRIVDERTRELVLAQRELERARRMSDIGRLASTIAHELRNPLSAIKTAAYNIQRKTAGQQLEKHVATINRKILESDHIIQNLLSFSRIRSAGREPVAVVEVLHECITTAALRYPGKEAAIERSFGIAPGELIEADQTQMKILFSNILDNAFQALPEKGGRIAVRISRDKSRVYSISIEDNGPGIPQENLSRIFEPFYTTKSKGTGLGLAICREIAEMHGGKILVESGPGKGALFRVTLPARRPGPGAADRPGDTGGFLRAPGCAPM